MSKKSKKQKGKKMTTSNDKPKSKTNSFFGDEIIRVRKAKFVDGETVGQFLRSGGTKATLRAGIKSGSIEIEAPKITNG